MLCLLNGGVPFHGCHLQKLEIWMKRLKMSQSTRSTPNGSPRSLVNQQQHQPSLLQHHQSFSSSRKYSTLPRMGNRASPTPLTQADRSYHGGSQNWQADLLSAADSVTHAMTSLVRELNSGMGVSEHLFLSHISVCDRSLRRSHGRMFRQTTMQVERRTNRQTNISTGRQAC